MKEEFIMSEVANMSREARLVAHQRAIVAAENDPTLSPETGKPLSKAMLTRFGAGFLIFGILWMSGLGIVSAVLLPEHYKSIEGIQPEALLGIVNAATAIASLVANLMFGNFSDRSRSRFGRRTPWILFGAVLGGVTLFLTGTTSNPVLLTIFYCGSMFGLNCMIAPLVAILSDRIPSAVRGTMSAFYGAGATVGAPIGTLIGAYFISNLIPGFAVAGVLMFLGGLVAILIIPREEAADYLPKEGGAKEILASFRPPKFSTAHDFYKAFVGRFCMLVSYQMITAYQLYIVQNYVGQSTKESAATISVISLITMVVSLLGSICAGPFSDFIGRRKLPVIIASVCFAVGIAMPWIFPTTTTGMYLYAAIAGLGYGVYSSVDQALLVDVLPDKAQAGKDLGILNLATTLGQMCGPIIMSSIVLAAGYVFAFPVAIILALLGCVFILLIKGVK